MDRNFFATLCVTSYSRRTHHARKRSTNITAKTEVICVNLSHHDCLLEMESLLLLLLFVQHEKLKTSESVETNMEHESGLTLDALTVIAQTPFALRSGRTWTGLTYMGSAISMMEAFGSKELEGGMDFFFSMSL